MSDDKLPIDQQISVDIFNLLRTSNLAAQNMEAILTVANLGRACIAAGMTTVADIERAAANDAALRSCARDNMAVAALQGGGK